MERDNGSSPYKKQNPNPSGSNWPGEPHAADKATMPPRNAWVSFLILLLINYFLVKTFFADADAPVTIPYTVFKQEVTKGNVKSIYSQGVSIEGRFGTPVTWPPKEQDRHKDSGLFSEAPSRTASFFTTTLPAFVDPGLEQFLIDNKVEISAVPIKTGSASATLLFGFGPALLLIGFYVWIYRRAAQQGGGLSGSLFGIGKSRARRYDQEHDAHVTFDDVAGIDEAENELVEVVDFLKDPCCAQGRAAGRLPGHRQDTGGEGGCRRGGRAVLLDERGGIRGNDSRRGRCAGSRSLQVGARACARHHLHRRA
jgi:cell division protease FtsH